MATKKCDNDKISQLLAEYDSGCLVVDLATKYGVHQATIRRYLRSNGRELGKLSHTSLMDSSVKLELKKVLAKGLKLDDLISELDRLFVIDKRQLDEDNDFKIYHL